MSKITNVGILDVRDITEEVAKEITSMENIGMLIESNESQIHLKKCKKINISGNMKISKDADVNVLTQNGVMKLDKDYLEGLLSPTVIVINGNLIIEKDVTTDLLNEKLYYVIVNGQIICTKKIAGVIQSKGMVNGEIIKYNNDYKFFDNMKITDRFLKGLKPDSKLVFRNLVIIEDINLKLFEEKISNIEVFDKLILLDKYEDEISDYIDEYYQVDKVLIPEGRKGTKYIDNDINIDDNSIKKYNHTVLYVDGDVEISLEDSLVFSEYIEHLACNTVICNKENYDMIKDLLSEGVNVEIVKGKLLKNTGKMILSGDIEEETTIKNMAKLVIDEKLSSKKFNENVVSITNYGLIEVPEDMVNMIKNKMKNNYGKISISSNGKDKGIQDEEDVLYSNIGELRL